jgi:hypothetical protein
MSKHLAWLPTSFADFIAGLLVIGGLIILCFGIDGEVKSITIMGAGWLFGRTWQNVNQKGE